MTEELEAALRETRAIASSRRKILETMGLALDQGDTGTVIRCARQLLGRDGDAAEGDRAAPRLD
jgi:hypothetical protein